MSNEMTDYKRRQLQLKAMWQKLQTQRQTVDKLETQVLDIELDDCEEESLILQKVLKKIKRKTKKKK